MASNLILTGGPSHPFAEAAAALAGVLAPLGIASTVTEDLEAGLADLSANPRDLLTVYALRWRMLADRYAPVRAQWAMRLSDAGRAAILAHVERGGALLALHTAVICFDDWPEWRDVLGGVWDWARSSHPPHGAAEVRMAGIAHPIVDGLPDFAFVDEVYGELDLLPDTVPLMHARASGTQAGWQPTLWTRTARRGRVVFDGLGHDAASITHPVHRRIVARAALWALGRLD